MIYPFPPDIAALVRRQLESGGFASEDDVLRKALGTLDRAREDMAAIEAGVADSAAGRVRPFGDFDRAFRERNGIAGDDQ